MGILAVESVLLSQTFHQSPRKHNRLKVWPQKITHVNAPVRCQSVLQGGLMSRKLRGKVGNDLISDSSRPVKVLS